MDATAVVDGGGTLAALRAVTAALSSYALAGAPAAGTGSPAVDRPARIAAMEDLRSVLAAAQAAEVTALASDRVADVEVEIATVARPGIGKGRRRYEARRRMMAEVALARRISPWQATRFVAFAERVRTDLPETHRLLATGQLSERRAVLVWNAVDSLDPDQRRRVDAELAPGLPGWSDREVDQQARAAVYRIDPAGAVRRHEYAVGQRRVTVRPAPECMAWVSTLTTMPDAVALRAQLERDAAASVAAGDPRTRAQIMADLVVERVTGRSVAEGPSVAVELVITDQTLAGGDDPARFADGTPVPAPLARDLALGTDSDTGLDTAERRTVRRLFCDPAGRLITGETASRQFTAAMRTLIRLRDGICTTPWCDAPIHDIDHDDPHVHGGPTAVGNGRGMCRWCNTTKGAGRPPDPPVATAVDPPPVVSCQPRRSPVERRLRRDLGRQMRRIRRSGVLDERRAGVLIDLPDVHGVRR